MNAKPKIALFYGEGNLHSYTGNVALMLIENGYQVDFFLYKIRNELFNLKKINGLTIYDLTDYSDTDWVLFSEVLLQKTNEVLQKNAYKCFIGIERMGLIWAGLMSESINVPLIYYCLELFTSYHPDYAGNERFLRSKEAERKYHQRAVATIIQDQDRADVLLADNNSWNTDLLLVPISVLGEPTKKKSNYLQKRFEIPNHKKIILYYGYLRYSDELIQTAMNFPEDWILVIHVGGSIYPDIQEKLKQYHEKYYQNSKVVISTDFLPDNQIQNLISSANIGLVLYMNYNLNDMLTGSSSEKMALYLQSGLPVVTFDYPSFRVVIDKYMCGEYISNFTQLNEAIVKILANYEVYRNNAINSFIDHYEYRTQFLKVIKYINNLP